MSVRPYDGKAFDQPQGLVVPIGLVRLVIVLASTAVSAGTFYMLWKGVSLLSG